MGHRCLRVAKVKINKLNVKSRKLNIVRIVLKIKGKISEDYHLKISLLKETATRLLVSTDCNILMVLKAETLFST